MLVQPISHSRPTAVLIDFMRPARKSESDFLLRFHRVTYRLPQFAANEQWNGMKNPSTNRRRKRPDWTDGLKTRTANTLRAFGLTSRAELVALSPKALKRIPNLGTTSLQDIRRWLAMPHHFNLSPP
jgi:DNA-directed RNA polymerase alpha subunit